MLSLCDVRFLRFDSPVESINQPTDERQTTHTHTEPDRLDYTHAPAVLLHILAELRVDRVHLPLRSRGGEQGGHKELRKAVQRAFDLFVWLGSGWFGYGVLFGGGKGVWSRVLVVVRGFGW